MPQTLSAGILLYRSSADRELQVWIAHMGGPFWARKDAGAWSILKGEYEAGEDPLDVALREFEEENGVTAPDVEYRALGEFRQSSGKVITVFTARFDETIEWVGSNTFELEWPRGSGRMREFPEVDRAEWVGVLTARDKLVKGQRAVLDALEELLGRG